MTEYKRIFLDTTPLIYFLDADENFGNKARQIFEEILSSSGVIISSVITQEEYSVYPYRTGNRQKLEAFHDFVDNCGIVLLPITETIADCAARIRAEYAGFKGMDSLQLAAALEGESDIFLTNDKQLKQFSKLRVVTVEEWDLN